VRLTCGVGGLSTQAFYKWRSDPISDRECDDAHLVNAIRNVHDDDPEFGYPFVADELERAGHVAPQRRVWRLCCEHRIWSTTTKNGRKGAGKRPGRAVHDDLVQRNFRAPAPDRVWLTDLTEHPTSEGKLYICCVKDVCSRRICWRSTNLAIDDHVNARSVISGVRG
jgi:putative transposase